MVPSPGLTENAKGESASNTRDLELPSIGRKSGQYQGSSLPGQPFCNVVSHQESVEWIDRAIGLVKPHAGQITLRGDTDFSHTAQLDRWDDQGIKFMLGFDANPKVVRLAQGLSANAWKKLERVPKYEILTEPRLHGLETV